MTTNHNHRAPSSPAIHRLNQWLEHFSRLVTYWSGSSWAFGLAVLVIVVWLVSGPIFGFSDTWQLVINTGTTIVTFLMVFLIQRSQNKDAQAIQIKLDELLASQPGASNHLINVEDWSEDEISSLHERFAKLSEHLQNASDACEPHSIVETKEIVQEAEELAGKAEDTLERVREDHQRNRLASSPRQHPR
jgi:low affinity Fe/Cu permease